MPEDFANLGRDRHYYEDLSDELFQFFGCGDADNFKRTYYPLPELRARFKKGNCDINYTDDYDVIIIKDEDFTKPLQIVQAFNDALSKSDRLERIKTKVEKNVLKIYVPSFVDPEWRVIKPEFRKVAVENFEACLEDYARTFDFNLLNSINSEQEAIQLFNNKIFEEFPKIKKNDLLKAIDLFKEELNNLKDDIMNVIWDYDWSKESKDMSDESILSIIKTKFKNFPKYMEQEFISEVRDILDDLNYEEVEENYKKGENKMITIEEAFRELNRKPKRKIVEKVEEEFVCGKCGKYPCECEKEDVEEGCNCDKKVNEDVEISSEEIKDFIAKVGAEAIERALADFNGGAEEAPIEEPIEEIPVEDEENLELELKDEEKPEEAEEEVKEALNEEDTKNLSLEKINDFLETLPNVTDHRITRDFVWEGDVKPEKAIILGCSPEEYKEGNALGEENTIYNLDGDWKFEGPNGVDRFTSLDELKNIIDKYYAFNKKVKESFIDTLPTYDPLEEEVKENIDEALENPPVQILSEQTILDFVHNDEKATATKGPVSKVFNIGYVSDASSKIAAAFKGGRGSVNKETGEANPIVKLIKCTEFSKCYLEHYSDSKVVKAARGDETEEEKMAHERKGYTYVERGVFRSNSNPELLALAPLMQTDFKARVKYFMSINGEEWKEVSIDEIKPYATGSAFAPRPAIEGRPTFTLPFTGIYMLGNNGHSIF